LQELFSNDSIQVIQHGFPSWSPILELNWILKKGLKFKPDIVVQFLYYNDFNYKSNSSDIEYAKYTIFDTKGYPTKFYFDELNVKRRIFSNFKRRLTSLSLIQLIKNIYSNKQYKNGFALPIEEIYFIPQNEIIQNQYTNNNYKTWYIDLLLLHQDTSNWIPETKDRVNFSMDFTQKLNDTLDNLNIQFYLCLIPHPYEFKNENLAAKKMWGVEDYYFPQPALEKYIAKYCDKNEIEFLPFYEHFNNYLSQKPMEKLYYDADTHWNKAGHKLAAKIIYENLK
jgi:hypothetical protein